MYVYIYICVCIYIYINACSVVSNSLQLYGLCSPPGFSVHRILQAKILEWVAIFLSRGSGCGLNPPFLCLLHCRQIFFFFFTTWAIEERFPRDRGQPIPVNSIPFHFQTGIQQNDSVCISFFYIYTSWITLLYTWNIVNQLHFNKKC